MEFSQTDRNKVRRVPDRGYYDEATVNEILDGAFLCHVGFVLNEQPFVIPTLYGREAKNVYLHGSSSSC